MGIHIACWKRRSQSSASDAGLDDDAYDIAAQAWAAWEAAVCWDPSGTDQFAVKRLAEVRAV